MRADAWPVFPDRLVELVLTLSLRDRVFLVVAISIAVLVGLSLAFAVSTLVHRALAERKKARREEMKEQIEPLILDALAGDRAPEEVWERVPDGAGRIFVRLLLGYADRLRGNDLDRARHLASPYLDEVVRRARDPVPERRAWAIRALSTLGPSAYRDELRTALDDPVPLVALFAARALTETGEAELVRPILERIGRFDLWSPRYVAEMVAAIGPEASAEVREVYLDDDAPPAVRIVAAHALREIGAPEGADLAVRVLLTDPQDEVTVASLRILGDVGTTEHAEAVRPFVDDPRPVVRAVALSALGALGAPTDDEAAARRLDDPSRWVALHAARTLRDLDAAGLLDARRKEEGDAGELAREILGPGPP